jgi:hypothetical protein
LCAPAVAEACARGLKSDQVDLAAIQDGAPAIDAPSGLDLTNGPPQFRDRHVVFEEPMRVR